MSDDEKENENGIYKVDTVPPPAGEDDAYSAPTKIGEMASPMMIREMMAKTERDAVEDRPPSSKSPRSKSGLGQLMPSAESLPPRSSQPSEPPPRVYEEVDEDDIATRLGEAARPPGAPPPVPRPTPRAADHASPPAPTHAPAPLPAASQRVEPALGPLGLAHSTASPSGGLAPMTASAAPRSAATPFVSSPLDQLAASHLQQSRTMPASRIALVAAVCFALLVLGISLFTCAR